MAINKYMFRKIHFIKINDFNYINAGDIYCSPYIWFHDFFDKYSCVSHCLSSVRYDQISKEDIVIIGGGGLINYNPWFNFNIAINKILSLCNNVILWGAGFNCAYINGTVEQFSPKVDFSKFKLYGIRDFQFDNYNYVPCCSCMNPLLSIAHSIKPKVKYGSMLHPLMKTKSLPIDMDNVSHFSNINAIMDFISDHEIIVTNSYHCALWSMLAGRKVVSPSSLLEGNKFNFFEKKPEFCSDWSKTVLLQQSMDKAVSYPDFLNSSVSLTIKFFEKVKDIVIETIPLPDKSIEHFLAISSNAEYYWKLNRINKKK